MAVKSVSHLPFDATRTYTGRYRNWFYNHHSDKITGRVLDLGAGSGWNSDQYEEIGEVDEYIALDISAASSIDIQGDGTCLPFKSGVFDTVIVSAVIEHIPVSKMPALLSEVRRVLSPGGRLIAGIPHQYPLHDEPYDFWRPTIYGMKDLLESEGFDSDNIECYQGGSYSEVLLHGLFFPFRAITLYLGIRRVAWLFAPIHYFVCALAQTLSLLLTAIYGTNPFGSRWYLQTFVIVQNESP